MSALPRSVGPLRLPGRVARRDARPHGNDAQRGVRPIATLAAVALATALVAGAFAGIVLVVAGLAGLAAYAAGHPHRPE